VLTVGLHRVPTGWEFRWANSTCTRRARESTRASASRCSSMSAPTTRRCSQARPTQACRSNGWVRLVRTRLGAGDHSRRHCWRGLHAADTPLHAAHAYLRALDPEGSLGVCACVCVCVCARACSWMCVCVCVCICECVQVRGAEYAAFVDEVMNALVEKWPSILVQFEVVYVAYVRRCSLFSFLPVYVSARTRARTQKPSGCECC